MVQYICKYCGWTQCLDTDIKKILKLEKQEICIPCSEGTPHKKKRRKKASDPFGIALIEFSKNS